MGVCSVKVVVRVRPLLARDFVASNGKPPSTPDRSPNASSSSSSNLAVNDNSIAVNDNKISINQPKDSKLQFEFSNVCDQKSTQQEIFDKTASNLIGPFMSGAGNVAIISYGQTGSGKTHTMVGFSIDDESDGKSALGNEESLGVIPRVTDEIFARVTQQNVGYDFEIRASFIEIYNENCFDLLSIDAKVRLELRENNRGEVYFPGARSELIRSTEDVIALLARGGNNRAIACTRANRESSRGHAVFIVSCRRVDRLSRASLTSFLYLADLAGSEKVCSMIDNE